MSYSHVSVAIPMMAELANLPMMLRQLREQRHRDFSVYCCVNQPETDRSEIFEENQETLRLLGEVNDLDLHLIDRSSPGCGWSGKRKGVGWARKELFNAIVSEQSEEELIVSMDADTEFSPTYLEAVLHAMNRHPEWSALSVPYYHPLNGDELQDRALLRYECYMRHYLINLLLIGNPYAFSALGSAMVFSTRAYRRVGGITPLQGGEDFYLLQKFAKTGIVGRKLEECVRPQGRISHRVPFGTGPAVAQGVCTYGDGGDMECGYPFYPHAAFAAVRETFKMMPRLYYTDEETPMSAFLRQQLDTDNLWEPLRKNFKTRDLFVHACHERVDGLRILQYLKTQLTPGTSNNAEFVSFCQQQGIAVPPDFSFATSPIGEIDALRDALFALEMRLR